MIGCIGVAPAAGESSTLEPAYPWGGNMDLRELEPGATLYLPVQVPGALLDAFGAYAFASARLEMRFGGPASPIVLAVVPDW